MQEIGVGLIGYGLGGRAFHAPYITVTPGLDLRAVVSSDAGKVHADLPGMSVVPSVDALLGKTDIDLVVVSSPDHLHADHAIAALRAGKHVVVDKPFACTLPEAHRIVEAASCSGSLLTVFHNRRWDADFLTLKRLMAEQALGDVVHFESHFDRWRPEPAAVWKEAREGGSWMDLGPHLVDQTLCLFGMPRAVDLQLRTLRRGAPSPDFFHAVLQYDDCIAVLHSSKLAADHRLRFAVHGTGGSWIKHGLDPQEGATLAGIKPGAESWGCDPDEGTYVAAATPDQRGRVRNEPGDYLTFWHQLVAAIQGRGENPVPAEQGLAVMQILEAGLTSATLNRSVQL